jgi:hypothetical protein
VFSSHDRDHVRDRILALASSDPRVVGGAVLGSFAIDEGDDWSDLDLMFAVADGVPITDVLEAWSRTIVRAFDATALFDLPSGPIIYRVFLFPDDLELDLSFTPASTFGADGPKFKLLFGDAVDVAESPPVAATELFGYAVHHAFHARACVERGRYWQAQYWISAVRDHALTLECLARGLEGTYGRDFDRLPADVVDAAKDALVRSLHPDELRRALGSAVAALLRGSGEVGAMVGRVEGQLKEIAPQHLN